MRACVVTDSGAHFMNEHAPQQSLLTVVHNQIKIGDTFYKDGVDLKSEEVLRLYENPRTAPEIIPPSTADYLQVYSRLCKTYDAVISIHTSRHLSQSWRNAQAAAQQMGGGCQVAVIDSQTLCVGQAMLVQVALNAVQSHKHFESLVKFVRGAVERVYSVYYVESSDYLQKNAIMSAPHTFLGTMLKVKPFLAIEDGKLIAIEKVRTQVQAVDRLVEFLVEFTDIEDVAILQPRIIMTEQTRLLQDRLTMEFPGRHFPYTIYNAVLASMIGTDATGITVLEAETSQQDYEL